MKTNVVILLLVLVVGVFGLQSTVGASDPVNTKNDSPQDQAAQDKPSTCVFSKIALGMGLPQVTDLIGPPSDTEVGATGKNWIPFYFGSDRIHTVCYYKGEGKLFFNGKGRLYKIEANPKESGYR